MYITVLYCCCCTGDTILPKLANVVSVSTQFHVSNIIYFFVENEFLQNSNSDYKFSPDSGTRKLCINRYSFTKTKLSNERKICWFVHNSYGSTRTSITYSYNNKISYIIVLAKRCFSKPITFVLNVPRKISVTDGCIL